MEYEHKLNITVLLSEFEEARLMDFVRTYKEFNGVDISPDDMLKNVISFGISSVLTGGGGCGGGGCGGCGGCSDEEAGGGCGGCGE